MHYNKNPIPKKIAAINYHFILNHTALISKYIYRIVFTFRKYYLTDLRKTYHNFKFGRRRKFEFIINTIRHFIAILH